MGSYLHVYVGPCIVVKHIKSTENCIIKQCPNESSHMIANMTKILESDFCYKCGAKLVDSEILVPKLISMIDFLNDNEDDADEFCIFHDAMFSIDMSQQESKRDYDVVIPNGDGCGLSISGVDFKRNIESELSKFKHRYGKWVLIIEAKFGVNNCEVLESAIVAYYW